MRGFTRAFSSCSFFPHLLCSYIHSSHFPSLPDCSPQLSSLLAPWKLFWGLATEDLGRALISGLLPLPPGTLIQSSPIAGLAICLQ